MIPGIFPSLALSPLSLTRAPHDSFDSEFIGWKEQIIAGNVLQDRAGTGLQVWLSTETMDRDFRFYRDLRACFVKGEKGTEQSQAHPCAGILLMECPGLSRNVLEGSGLLLRNPSGILLTLIQVSTALALPRAHPGLPHKAQTSKALPWGLSQFTPHWANPVCASAGMCSSLDAKSLRD